LITDGYLAAATPHFIAISYAITLMPLFFAAIFRFFFLLFRRIFADCFLSPFSFSRFRFRFSSPLARHYAIADISIAAFSLSAARWRHFH
jgi:hypothetical protein